VGIRQGIFLPLHRTLDYQGDLIVRAATQARAICGQIRVGLSRRAEKPEKNGEILAQACLEMNGEGWAKLPFDLHLSTGSIHPHEPLDFYILWIPYRPINDAEIDLLVDRAQLFPCDAIEGMDPDVIRKARAWNVPLLRWPGGNFVSHYHWRDGVGVPDRRPTRPNYAWGGLEYNTFGTVEFIHFCRLVGCQPHLVVNTGTGTAEEAAAWVEFCNGGPDTPMGKLRAKQGDVEPYGVRLWEVGNEIYGAWQGGYHGGEENACRFVEFSEAMRHVDPSIELIATGNPFDFVQLGVRFDRAHADQHWHRTLIDMGGKDLDTISLHSLPIASDYPDGMSDEEVYYSILSQPAAWERVFLPALLSMADDSLLSENARKPIRLAITEWGALGSNPRRPRVENFSGALYAGIFLNMLIRNAGRIPIANATALLHGGCIRKAAGQVFVDAQYPALQQYTCLFPGTRPLACRLEGPGYDVQVGADSGAPVQDVPYVDAVACLVTNEQDMPNHLVISAVNIHLTRSLPIVIRFTSGKLQGQAQLKRLADLDPYGVASLADPERFALQTENLVIHNGCLQVELPPCSINWITMIVG
jgi:alpha-N-arabinofuranosidase